MSGANASPPGRSHQKMTTKTFAFALKLFMALPAVVAFSVFAQQTQTDNVRVLHVRGPIYMIAAA
jgi:hypothetical protein